MTSTRDLNQKIGSLKSTKKITSAMKMIAATKLFKAQRAKDESLAYKNGLDDILHSLSQSTATINEPMLAGYNEVKKTHAVLFTSDRGLCGSFNSNTIKRAVNLATTAKKNNQDITFSFVGRRGHDFFVRHGYTISHYYEGVAGNPSYESVQPVADDIMNEFNSGTTQQVWLVYNRFVSVLSQNPVAEMVLPMSITNRQTNPESEKDADKKFANEYIMEPGAQQLMRILLPRFIRFQVFHALLESAASEHGARMTSMDAATGNCSKLTDQYILLRNRARQAAITTELIEITSGREALK